MPRTDASIHAAELDALSARICACTRCPRLVDYLQTFRDDSDYWARPVPAFGDPSAKILVLGLAPGAHGANRTGRPFTGDGAGTFLYQALHGLGLATQAQATARGDGLELHGVWITNAVRCVPPANKPTPEEQRACSTWLLEELRLLSSVRAIVALGRTAHDAALRAALTRAESPAAPARSTSATHADARPRMRDFAFAHGAEHRITGFPVLFDCFHTSRYNANTGRVTLAMVEAVFARAVAAAR